MKLLTILLSLTFFIGCGAQRHARIIHMQQPQPIITQQPAAVQKPIRQHKKPIYKKAPRPPKKHIKLKRVEETNYSDKYMYPEDTAAAKKDPIVKNQTATPSATTTSMSRDECISMIGQEKFDKYSTMFGSEAASIKRCTMLKAMKK